MKNRSIKSQWLTITLALIVVVIGVLSTVDAQETPTARDNYEITFTKWATCYSDEKECESPDGAMVIATMSGIITGGDAGTGSFSGEVLEVVQSTSDLWEAVPVYRVSGSTHDFSAHMLVMENPETGEATLAGIIVDGWMEGQMVQGTYTIVSSCPDNPSQPPDPMSPCVEVTLRILAEN